MSKRELIDTGTDKRYVRRDDAGRFKESDDVGKSLSADRRQPARTKAPAGQGDRGAINNREERATMSDPSDRLDPAAKQTGDMPRRGPLGDARPNQHDPDPRTRGGKPQEDVEDRPTVGTVEPEDYPAKDRADSAP